MFERKKANDELREKEWSACLLTQFSLGQYAQTLIRLKSQFLDGVKGNSDRHLIIKHVSFDDRLPEIDINSLGFILTTKEPDLLNRIQNAFSNCKSAIDSVKERNVQYRHVASLAELIQNPSGDHQYKLPEIEVKLLSDFTDNMYEQIDYTMNMLPETQKALHDFIKANFKGKHALKMIDIHKN